MGKYTREDILRIADQQNIRYIRLQFTDILGTLKNMEITRSQFEKALDNGCMFNGSSVEGFVRIEDSDMFLHPDYDTFAIFPWQSPMGEGNIARLICDVYRSDGTPFDGDPRFILKNAIKKANYMGFTFNVGTECEFFLFNLDAENKPTVETDDKGGYFDLGPMDKGEDCRREICSALEDMGFEVEGSHHEVSMAQHVIDFKYDEVLRTADNVTTFKYVAKNVALQNGFHATFMPKPIFGVNGSGMHTNMSLFKGMRNAFYDENDINALSQTAYKFIAGIMEHAKAMTLILNPLVNSYKRLVQGYDAPSYIAWSAKNRSPLIRIPATRGIGTRLELRSPDPSCNPYLMLAVCLMAGLDGIEKGLTPPPSIDTNIFDLGKDKRKEAGIDMLPDSLERAIEFYEKDGFMNDALGGHVFYKFLAAKKKEWRSYRSRVSHWELDNYLTKY